MNDDGTMEAGPASQPYGSARPRAKDVSEVPQDDQDLICEVKKYLEQSISADSENYKAALDDLRFLKGEQWPETQRRAREAEGRPCLTINKIPTFLQQITNDQRQNRANIKVSAVSEQATGETAEVIQGMIKHIEYDSSADTAYDTAVNSASSIGFGFFRLVTEYESDESFDQVIRFKRIRNPFTVHFDPSSTEADGSDAQRVAISNKMTKDEFKAKYPDAICTIQGFDIRGVGDSNNKHWVFENQVRVAEYYKVIFTPTTLYKLGDGSVTTEQPPEGVQIIAQRPTVTRKVMWYLITPYEVLEQTEIKCNWIPVFPVWGTEIDLDGKVFRAGLIRNAKDPAMMYNFWMTSATEEVSLRPKTPYIGAEGQFEGHTKKWNTANVRSWPYLEYKPVTVDNQLAPPPQRQAMADVPSGILAMAAHASDNIKQTTGLFDSSLGAAGNATSGKQELAQQKQGSVTNYHYMDNFFRTLKHAGRCLLWMIPFYYDTERIVQSQGEDGSIEPKTINKWDEIAKKWINDVRVGRYAVVVTPGPSYAAMRAEAADAMIQFGQSWPKLMDVAGDKVVKAMNWPGADDIAKRIEKTIPQELRSDENENGEAQIPPEAQQKIAQLEQQLKESQEQADKNKTDIERERIKANAQVEAAYINKEGKSDVAELNGLVKLLIARLPAPPELSKNVAQDLAEPDYQSPEQVPQVAQSQQPMNGSPEMPMNG